MPHRNLWIETHLENKLMKVGLIGIGELGIAVAKNMLKAGHDLVVYDTRPDGGGKFGRISRAG